MSEQRNGIRTKVFNYLKGYIEAHGMSPTFREMADALGLRSVSGIYRHLDALEAEGAISVERCAESGNRRTGRIRINECVQSTQMVVAGATPRRQEVEEGRNEIAPVHTKIMGMDFGIDPEMPKDEIHFRDQDGRTVVKIVGLEVEG